MSKVTPRTEVNKYDITRFVAIQLGMSHREVLTVVDKFFDVVAEELHSDRDVNIAGALKITHVERGPRTARNPITGEPVDVPAKTVLKPRLLTGLLREGARTAVEWDDEKTEAKVAYEAKYVANRRQK